MPGKSSLNPIIAYANDRSTYIASTTAFLFLSSFSSFNYHLCIMAFLLIDYLNATVQEAQNPSKIGYHHGPILPDTDQSLSRINTQM